MRRLIMGFSSVAGKAEGVARVMRRVVDRGRRRKADKKKQHRANREGQDCGLGPLRECGAGLLCRNCRHIVSLLPRR